jgi:hypothetical protein
MADKLSVYNGALLALGERKLVSVTENRASRRRLDSVWDANGVKSCLQAGFWNFAMRALELSFSPSITPAFGLRYAFDKPSDWVRTWLVSGDDRFTEELRGYEDEGAYWYADPDTIWVRYVSNDSQLGGDLSLWPENFTRYVEGYFAWRICKSTTGSNGDKDSLGAEMERLLKRARATDAMDETTRFPPEGSWSKSRRGWGSRRDRGNRGSLIG